MDNLTHDLNPRPSLRENTLSALRKTKLSHLSAPEMKLVEFVVSGVFDVTSSELHQQNRCSASIAFARQVAMYLIHITCGQSFTSIGHFFGRDRTTVAYACQQIEDRREDPLIDWVLNLMEISINRLTTSEQSKV